MEIEELENSLYIVFEKEESDIEKGLSSFSLDKSKDNNLRFPNAETLVDLFSIIKHDAKLKTFFVDSLNYRISDCDDRLLIFRSIMGIAFSSVSPLCFYVLVKLGFVNEAIDSLKRRSKRTGEIFRLILYLIPMDYFDIYQLKEILTKVKTEQRFYFDDVSKKLEEVIIEKRFQLLNRQIKHVNVEINQDKKAVSEKISILGFDKSYNVLLEEIDNFINTETSKIVNAGLISNLRTFMANLLKDVAKGISEKKERGYRLWKVEEKMGNIRSYLKKKLELTDNDDKFVDSFINILHSEGGHAFMSEKEYFRLARNIAIEIALFVLSKYEKKFF